jgi:hypothetical protein
VATSTGPQKADFSRCELDREQKPSGSEYSTAPKVAPQPSKLPLPAGNKGNQGEHKDRLN